MEYETLLHDVVKIQKKVKMSRNAIMDSVDGVLDKLESLIAEEEEISEDALTNLYPSVMEAEPLRKILGQHKDTYAYISRLGKDVEKFFPYDPNKLNLGPELDSELLNKIVIQYLFREGFFKEAEMYQQEQKFEILDEEQKAGMTDLIGLVQKLKSGDIDSVVEWAAQNRERLASVDSSLEYYLHRLQFSKLLIDGNSAQALQYAKEYFAPFKNHYDEIKRLTGACLFPTATSPYQDLLDTPFEKQAVICLIDDLHKLIGFKDQNLLLTATIAGSYSIPCMIKLTLILKEDLWECSIPIDVPLHEDLNFHSIFVCPVSREISTPDNPPALLPCGHLVAQQTVTNLLATRNRFKCPTCPTDVSRDSIKNLII